MGQIANQALVELYYKLKQSIQEKRQKKKKDKKDTKLS